MSNIVYIKGFVCGKPQRFIDPIARRSMVVELPSGAVNRVSILQIGAY